MRQYDCFYYYKLKDGSYEMNKNTCCWRGIKQDKYIPQNADKTCIYIDLKCHAYNKSNLKSIVDIINQITPCEILSGLPDCDLDIKDEILVKYTFIQCEDFYSRNLFLLNFIRYIWYDYMDNASKVFFEELKKCTDSDLMVRLTTANKIVTERLVKRVGYSPNGAHSNLYQFALVRTMEDFNTHYFDSVESFIKKV